MSFDFDARSVEPQQPVSAIPEGWYQVIIARDEVKPTRDGQSHMLVQEIEVVASAEGNPQFKGRKLINRLNLWNKNQQATEIAQRTLSAICHVTGQLVLTQATGGTQALWGKPFQVLVGFDETGRFNEIKGYKDSQGNDPGRQGQPSASAARPVAIPPAAAPAAPVQQPQAPAPAAWPAQAQPQAPAVSAPVQFAPAGGPPPTGYPPVNPAQPPQPPQQPPAAAAPWGASSAAASAAPPWGAAPGSNPNPFPPAAAAPAAPQQAPQQTAPAWQPPTAGATPAATAPWAR